MISFTCVLFMYTDFAAIINERAVKYISDWFTWLSTTISTENCIMI